MAAHTENSIVINAPLDLVWTMTNNLESWPELFSEYAAVEILARRGNTVRFRLTMHPNPDGTQWSWVSERTMDPQDRMVRAQRVETGWFKYMNLFWEYKEVDGGVELRWVQDFELRSDAPVTDEGMAQNINRNSLVQLERIKGKVEEAAARLSAATGSVAKE